MGVYDIFLKNSHPKVISEWMVKNNQILLEYLSGYFPKNKKHIRLLEVGPGKGYLKDAVFRNNQKRGGGAEDHRLLCGGQKRSDVRKSSSGSGTCDVVRPFGFTIGKKI